MSSEFEDFHAALPPDVQPAAPIGSNGPADGPASGGPTSAPEPEPANQPPGSPEAHTSQQGPPVPADIAALVAVGAPGTLPPT